MNLTLKKPLLYIGLIAVALCGGVTFASQILLSTQITVTPPTIQAALWSSFTAATNGHTSQTEFANAGGEITNITWDTGSPLYGKTGFTAFSLESNFAIFNTTNGVWNPSQWGVPVTALTKRHCYIRGHSNGATNGVIDTATNSAPIHFLTADNQIVTRYEIAAFKEYGGGMDECLVLLDADLPDSIEPVTMIDAAAFAAKLAKNTLGFYPGFNPLLGTCQHNQIGTTDGTHYNPHNFYIDGDSGSPDFYLLNGAVVMLQGRTTTGYNAQMQADADALSRFAGLDPSQYQIKLLDLNQFSDR